MASKRHATDARPQIARHGEGTTVNVVVRAAKDVAGTNVQVIKASIESAPVPDRKYSAGVANAEITRGDVELMFGQEKIRSTELRSMVVVVVAPSAIQRLLESTEHMQTDLNVNVTASQIAFLSNIRAEDLPAIAVEPTQTIAFRANQVALAVSPEETCLDFYQASAFSMRVAGATKKLALDPIVRIEIRTSLFLALLNRLKDLSRQLDPLPTLSFD